MYKYVSIKVQTGTKKYKKGTEGAKHGKIAQSEAENFIPDADAA